MIPLRQIEAHTSSSRVVALYLVIDFGLGDSKGDSV